MIIMKKIITLLLLFSVVFLVSCERKEPIFDHDQDLDLENVFFDDFTNGINSEDWVVGNTKWGINNGGVIYENVHYTEDGVVILQSNGDYYDGPLKGINSNDGKRTGAMIKTREALGPGRYEVRMKILPRFGSTTAMWTFFYDNGKNHEIDIELNVENDFHVMMTTNWITETQFSTKKNYTDVVLNDFEWHVFRFDWRTNPNRIDYFLDDQLISTQMSYVPDHAGEFNIGNWFPDAWAGVPNFETDYTYVDWFKYTPFKNNEYVKTASNPASPAHHYPQAPIEYPIANLISNPGFEGDENAWRFDPLSNVEIQNNAGIDNSNAIKVDKANEAYQTITGLDETFELRIIANAKLPQDGSGYILIEFYPDETIVIGETILRFDSSDQEYFPNKYYQKEAVFLPPPGTKRVQIYLIGDKSDIYFDNLFFNLSKKPIPTDNNSEDLLKYDFYEDFTSGLEMSKWNISNRRWGGTHHGGVIHQNVHISNDNKLVLQANGDYYDGDLKGIESNDGKRTGAAIYTKEYFGPGSFEVVAKAMPRFGATTAFWTYNYETVTSGEEPVNSEIDIELNVQNDFQSVWFSNWLTEKDYINKRMKTPVINNDGKFHKYRFDWYTNPGKIEYYIDDVLYHTEYEKIPTLEAQFWIGVWFPNNWAGNPNFETDYLVVDSFTYKKFANQPFLKTKNNAGSTSSGFYPKEVIDLPVNNLISNGHLLSELGYELNNALIQNQTLKINNDGYAKQNITGMHESLPLELVFDGKGIQSIIEVEYFNYNNELIDKKFYNLDFNSVSQFKNTKLTIEMQKETKSINIIFKGTNFEYQNIKLNLKEG